MKKKIIIIVISVLSAIALFFTVIAIINAIYRNRKTPEYTCTIKMTASNNNCFSYNGESHCVDINVVALLYVDGEYQRTFVGDRADTKCYYTGVDNEYSSAVDPTDPGVYKVKIVCDPEATRGKLFQYDFYVELDRTLVITSPFKLSDDGEKIERNNGVPLEVENVCYVPSTLQGVKITTLSQDVFDSTGFSNVQSLKLPTTEFTLTDNLASILSVRGTFYIHENTKISDGVYTGLNNTYSKVYYYGEPKTIKSNTFSNTVRGFKELYIPDTVTFIEKDALKGLEVEKIYLSDKCCCDGDVFADTVNTLVVCDTPSSPLDWESICKPLKDVDVEKIILRTSDLPVSYFSGCKSKTLVIDDHGSAMSLDKRCFADCAFEELFLSLEAKLYTFNIGEWLPPSIKKLYLTTDYKTDLSLSLGDCGYLEEIYLPSSIKDVKLTVENLENLEKLVLPQGLEYVSVALENCPKLNNIFFAEGLKGIYGRSFANSGLSGDIVLPESLEFLSGGAFQGSGVTSITITSSNIIEFDTDYVWGGKMTYYVPAEHLSYYQEVFSNYPTVTVLSMDE